MNRWFTIDQMDENAYIISEYRHWEETPRSNGELPVKRVFPAHHSLDIGPEIILRMRDDFRQLKEDGKLHHGSGTFDYGDWAVWL